MFPTLPAHALPVRLAITATIPVGLNKPAQIVVTCDPPSDRFEVVWYQDCISDVLTPEEALDAIYAMTETALLTIERGAFLEAREAFPEDQLRRSRSPIDELMLFD